MVQVIGSTGEKLKSWCVRPVEADGGVDGLNFRASTGFDPDFVAGSEGAVQVGGSPIGFLAIGLEQVATVPAT